MLLVNASQLALCHPRCDIMLSSEKSIYYSLSSSTHTSFWSQTALEQFADFIWTSYTVPEKFKFYTEMWESCQANFIKNNKAVEGGVNDMTLAGKFAQDIMWQPELGLRVCNSISPIMTARILDHQQAYQFLSEIWLDNIGLPYTTFAGTTIPILPLHFQGVGKDVLNKCGL